MHCTKLQDIHNVSFKNEIKFQSHLLKYEVRRIMTLCNIDVHLRYVYGVQ